MGNPNFNFNRPWRRVMAHSVKVDMYLRGYGVVKRVKRTATKEAIIYSFIVEHRVTPLHALHSETFWALEADYETEA